MHITFPRVMICLAITVAIASSARTSNATPVSRNEQVQRPALTELRAPAATRDAVVAELVKLGVAPDEAKQRVASLSDAELATVQGPIESQAAGGDSTVTMGIGSAIIIALLLIIFL